MYHDCEGAISIPADIFPQAAHALRAANAVEKSRCEDTEVRI